MVTLLQNEVAQLGQAQRVERTEQRSLAIFRGATVIKGLLKPPSPRRQIMASPLIADQEYSCCREPLVIGRND